MCCHSSRPADLLRVLLTPELTPQTLLSTAAGLTEIQVKKELLHTCINIAVKGRKSHKLYNPVKN